LNLDTDLGDLFKQVIGDGSDENELEKFPLHLKTRIEFDLDPKTMKTLAARATSDGGFQVFITQYPDEAIAEQKFSGGTTMSLLK